MGGNSNSNGKPASQKGPPIDAGRGRPTNSSFKNTKNSSRILWRIKIWDTTQDDLSDQVQALSVDDRHHVDASDVQSVLSKHLEWFPNYRLPDIKLEVSIELGLFTAKELQENGVGSPETRNQVLLCQLGLNVSGTITILAGSMHSLVKRLKDLSVYTDKDVVAAYSKIDPRVADRQQAMELQLDENIPKFISHKIAGFSPLFNDPNVHLAQPIAIVAFWREDMATQPQNEDWKAHPGEWESKVCEHEIGHYFFNHSNDPYFRDVMEPFTPYDYSRYIYMPADKVDNYGSAKGIEKRFNALANHKQLIHLAGRQDLYLLYEGYPQYSEEQKKGIVDRVVNNYWAYRMTQH